MEVRRELHVKAEVLKKAHKVGKKIWAGYKRTYKKESEK